VTTAGFDAAVARYRAGDPAEARELLERFLEAAPDHAAAWHLLGVLRANAGDREAARAALERAAGLDPRNIETQLNLARVLQQLGANREAAAAFRQALAVDPSSLAAAEGAVECLWRERRYAEALEPVRRLVALQPGATGPARKLLGALRAARKFPDAEREARALLARHPEQLDVLIDVAGVLRDCGRADEAVELARRAVAMAPRSVEAHINLGAALSDREDLDGAAAAFLKVLDLKPDSAEVQANLGAVRYRQGNTDAAIACYRAALKSSPDNLNAHWNLSHALLQKGEYREGWAEYEWRWKTEKAALVAERRNLPWPRWEGGPVAGKSVFVYTEQGFGDGIQFARYVPLLAAAGARVTLETQKELERLFRSLGGVERLVARGATISGVELQVPIMSLPLAMGTTLANLPAAVPYLAAEPEAAARWRERLAGLPRPRVGLCWKGGRKFAADHLRSLSASMLAPLLGVREAGFVALQKELGPEELAAAGLSGLRRVADELTDFAETAALIANLDLVIAVDTSVAHLAGALGKPLWVMLPEPPDWRWLRGRRDSPWYPTAQLFRQPAPGDWAAVVAAVARALGAFRTPV